MSAPRFSRRAVAAGLAALTAPGSIRRAAGAQPTLTGQVAWPGDALYEDGRHDFNSRFDRYPAGIVSCADRTDVQNAITWARAQALLISVRSGGHSYEAYSVLDNRLLIDLGELTHLEVDHAAGTATIGPGVRLLDLYRVLAAEGVAVAAGTCPGVGLGGLVPGGGVGFRSRRDGLTCDALIDAEVVLADGRVVHVSASEQPELFWALRGGGGGNFGIATSFTLRTTPAEDVAMASITWPWDEAAQVISAWQAWAPYTDPRLSSSLAFFRPDSGVIGFTGLLLGPVDELEGLLKPLLATGTPSPYLRALSWLEAAEELAGPGGDQATFKNGSAFVYQPLPPEAIALTISQMSVAPAPANLISFFALGGAISEIAPGATAFPHRRALCDLQIQAYWQEPWQEAGNVTWVNGFCQALAPYTSGAYVNYIDADQPDWATAYYGRNLDRLMRVKARYDP
ncbi:MAG: FAD-binding oxidoreductase, partial [Chloroflexota bacterium]|nr:FAD-binding oxidoreductase [Chloroflexota bacterium]